MKMEVLNCIIVDDSEIDQLSLKAFLSKFPDFKILGTFSSPEKALQVIKDIEIDILFLDIQMPGLNGLELRKKLNKAPVCVFISYSQEYALESFELEVLDYIVKPLRFDRFEKTINKIRAYLSVLKQAEHNQPSDEFVYLKDGINQVKVVLNEIVYIEAFSDYTNIITKEKKQIISSNIGNMMKNPSFSKFIRIHRSYAVPKTTIHKVNRTEVILNDGTTLPIGRTYRDFLLQSL